MNKLLNIGIPVMMNSEDEILQFLNIKDYLESAMERSFPVNVNIFLYYNKNAVKDENVKLQLQNQKIYTLPIIHAQTSIKNEYSLDIVPSTEAERVLEQNIDHIVRMKEFDSSGIPLSIDTHVGMAVFDGLKGVPALPGVFSPEVFDKNRQLLFKRAQNRFSELQERVRGYGFEFLLENCYLTSMEPSPIDGLPRMHYFPFNDFDSQKGISGNNITVDVAHLAASKNVSAQYMKNGCITERNTLVTAFGVHNWPQYDALMPSLQQYLNIAKAIHCSNITGIGVHLEKYPELEYKWGYDGSIEGLSTQKQLHAVVMHARDNEIPLIFELDYLKYKNDKYRDVEPFLKYCIGTDY